MTQQFKRSNPDPVTGEPGSHPVGTGIGAASGAAAGAAVGTAAGPIGTATGAIVGAIAGGIAGGFIGREVAEYVYPTEVDAYWEENYLSRPYVKKEESFEAYRPAYKMGYDAASKHEGRSFAEVEDKLDSEWQKKPGSDLEWAKAKDAARDSYDYTIGLYNQRRLASKDENANNQSQAPQPSSPKPKL